MTRTLRTEQVVVLALENSVAFELGLPHRFLTADALRPTDGGPRPYEVLMCTVDDGPITTSAGYQVLPTHPHEALRTADTVVIVGTPWHSVMETGALAQPIRDALALVPTGARWVSICTGAFVLAALGLLDGRRATTHWAHADAFRRCFPDIELDADVLFIDHGDVLTSAGNAAGIDLLLHLVRRDHGVEVANRVARGAVVAPWRDGGQAQFIDRPVPAVGEGGTASTREWALRHLEEDLSLARLAQHAGMSVRTFTRRFREETGQTAGEWITGRRVEHARHLLEKTDWPVDRVAAASGFGTAAAFRAQFRTGVGISPSAYRRGYLTPA
ncbi:helix-turn-helix domain-containing protein [Luteipulveratus sp. YIM 133132]|uniref:GlxA family transcriptional regulator n=1 Tax=Luteipulveratus flavus TaxID=3031728 RepID=UPI0023B15797|nr:helix-turn-helix domain-containing protein [Luteipulveratus sp. YIM 133132]MDE9367618.1 helix-turn-helix domain-containing protein [Luteipulveratus sp. YIM 133132]